MPVKVIYAAEYEDKSAALRAEYAFKQLTRSRKEQFLKERGEGYAESEEF